MDPKTLRYTKSHEWIAADGTVGISDHAQHEITDVVFVEPPKTGRAVKAEEACAVVESVKAAFDIYAPVAGTIAAVNDEAAKNPAIVNQSPYDKGWLFKIQMAAPTDREKLMTADQYAAFVKTGAH
ncbi:MAG: glycine cleavage system protein GcvH [Elusimicrobia bacterium]|jgi:glycine cleavage system H protein|nr:MAG: glycine cleavage system protein GcvH [Elusimicrobiota bacterium]